MFYCIYRNIYMRFIRNIVCFLFFLPFIATAQTYKYIGVENGLSNRRIFDIQKDSIGYMWFLTNEGIDRYNGKDIKHYKLIEEDKKSNSPIHLGWLYFEDQGKLWVIGKSGCIFQYNQERDSFNRIYKLPKASVNISCSYMDHNNRIWLCSKYSIILYDTKTGETHQMPNELKRSITSIEQIDNNHFFMGTSKGARYVKLENKTLQIVPLEPLDKIRAQISALYFHQESQRLFIGTFEKGVFAYDIRQQRIIHSNTDLSDVNIARIRPLNRTELLIATEGMGIHKINVNSCISEPYITSNYKSYNEMNSNNINDIYIDEEKRIWIANYPEGITIIDNRYKNYNWIKHSIGNRQSLVNDQVHSVIEDSDGDLWFGTSNGISLYQSKTGQWHSFLSSFDHQLKDKNHIFITLCEVSPGIIWAGGYTSGVYKINKRTLSVEYFSPYLLNPDNIRPDKYIRDIVKDSKGYIWSGGFYNLKCFDLSLNSVRLYPGINSITAITEKDDGHMWIGTSAGLYLLDKESGRFQYVALQEETTYINTLYQAEDLSLYIGTNGSGVVVYNAKDSTFKHYHKDNCALISNNIYTILPESDGHILMSTENGISCFHPAEKIFHNLLNAVLPKVNSCFHPAEKIFHNWTKEQGLMSSCFSASSGTLRKNKGFVFGSTDGAIEFPEGTRLPKYIYSPMILSDFQIFYQTVFPGSMNSPLKENINQTDRLKLKYNQNTFSLNISSINYDAPDNVTFYWKLEGFYDDWNRLSEEGHLRFTNLASGDYKLCIRAVSKEEPYLYFEERSIDISIARPVWFSFWAIACYVLLAALMFITGFRIIALRKQKKISDEKTRFFVNTAHDIRTPLTLIKAPLEEMLENKTLNEAETNNMHMALRNVNSLLHMTTNLINFERAEVYSSHLYIAEYELNTYIKEIYNIFRTYAAIKHISFRYESNFSYMNVWFDKEKMDSILKNVISNALKYTPEKGDILISVYDIGNTWRLEIKDNGIGIPAKEQRKLFKMHFRGTNAINSKTTGSGIGLMLVRKLVNLHNGKIHIESTEHQGTTIRITLPKDKEQFKHFTLAIKEKKSAYELDVPITPSERTDSFLTEDKDKLQRILIVEDNDELRNYLLQSFSPNYNVQVCGNGKEALAIVKQFWPELILSDIMMPEMRGDELCTAIKSDIETSHIPILLLTALGDEKNILEGLQIGADEYIVKPFSINILKASIANLLANRALLRKKYADLEINAAEEEPPTATCSNSLDWIFMSNVKKNIEDNIDNPDFTVDTLCSLLNMSRTSFYNKLKALTAQAPADFVRNIRLKHAANLLKEGKYSITEVAERTGFCDGKYFREVFKKYFNVSPSQYAKGDTPRSPKGEGE